MERFITDMMTFSQCIQNHTTILMEGALGERLKREFNLSFDTSIAMASLIYTEKGREALATLWKQYIEIARKYHFPFMATTPTRRANYERIHNSDYTDAVITDHVHFLRQIQKQSDIEMYVGGLMGCKGDAYTGADALSEKEAITFHSWTVNQFYNAGIDVLYAGIMPTLPEAAGLAQAIDVTGIPYIISFTINKDGTLIDGTTIADAIYYIDQKTQNKPVCYMTNCVHPNIVYQALSQPCNDVPIVKERFRGIQANTSPLSYAELDGSKILRCSNPETFAREMMQLNTIGNFHIWGGCCGTDNRHIECVAQELKKRTTTDE